MQVTLFFYLLIDTSPVPILREIGSKCRGVVCEYYGYSCYLDYTVKMNMLYLINRIVATDYKQHH